MGTWPYKEGLRIDEAICRAQEAGSPIANAQEYTGSF